MTFPAGPLSPPADLLPELHRRVLSASGGTASVVLHRSPRSGAYVASSGRGFADLGGPTIDADLAAELEAATQAGSVVRPLASLPGLAGRLEGDEALVVPLADSGEPAFLIVAAPAFGPTALDAGARAQVEFSLALRVARLAKRQAVYRTLQELFLAFTRGIAATLSLGRSLEAMALDTNVLFGTRRVSIWLHHRRARQLTLAACSDPTHARGAIATDADDPAAHGLRLDHPRLDHEGGAPTLLAPLRGWRRALGTVVIEGAPADLDEVEYLEAAYELARQLSGAIENVQLLDEVLQHRRLLEDTFNSLADLVVVVDTEWRVVQTNEAFATRIGTARPELLARPLAELVSAEMAGWVSAADRGEAARSRQFTDERLDGVFAATVTPLLNQDGEPTGQVLVIRDITAQTALEREQAALRERLAQSQKLASLGQFVAGIAHEMNNPLQSVLGHLELLIATSEAAKPVRPTLKRIYQEGDRAAKIVRNLLVFAGSRRMARQRIAIERVVARAVASRAAALRRERITVVRHAADGTPSVSGDPLLLQQAFLNMLINAEHAILERDARGDRPEDRRIDVAVTALDTGLVRTTIRDTGSGIPPDVLPRIFDPFFTTKDVGQGTGLGLAITYGIIQDHGGTIEAANVPDGGAIFMIDLPAFAKDPAG